MAMSNYIHTEISSQLKSDWLSYSLASLNRAIPSAIDGLLPVQRRILQIGLDHSYNRLVKTVRWAGDVMGRLHPHGDSSITGAIYGMVSKSRMIYPLIEGQGNFGGWSHEGYRVGSSPPAAARYTEVKLSEFAKQVYDLASGYKPNFDQSTQEVVSYVPALPILLLNGNMGIATGYSSNVLSIDAQDVISLIEGKGIREVKPRIVLSSGCTVLEDDQYWSYLESGTGNLTAVGKYKKDGKAKTITITQLPLVDAETYCTKLADAVKNGKVSGVVKIEDLSHTSIEIVLTVGKKFNPDVVLSELLAHTPLQDSLKGNLTVMVDGLPVQCGVQEIIKVWRKARVEALGQKYASELQGLREQISKLQALILAVSQIDAVISIIKKSKTRAQASEALIQKFDFTPLQAQAILSKELGQLVNTETQDLESELQKCEKLASKLEKLNPKKLEQIVLKTASDLVGKFYRNTGTSLTSKLQTPKAEGVKAKPPRNETDSELIYQQGKELGFWKQRRVAEKWLQEQRGKGTVKQVWADRLSKHKKQKRIRKAIPNILDRKSSLNVEELLPSFNDWARGQSLPTLSKAKLSRLLWDYRDDVVQARLAWAKENS